jgi:adenosylmethionine-8-amino-7-oxononanoate aminotransferase
LSVVLTRDEIYQAFYAPEVARAFLHSHSYTGNPLACRAALATLDIFARDDVLTRNRASALTLDRLLSALAHEPRIEHLRRCGMIWAFDVRPGVVRPGEGSFARRYAKAALDRGALLRPIGHTVYLMPPYVLNEAELSQLAQACLGALADTTLS